MSSAPHNAPASRVAHELAAAVAALYLGAALYTNGPWALGPDLETSWVWAINGLADSSYAWGRDVVYPYGPLGYLLLPMDMGAHVSRAAAALAVVSALIAIASWTLLRRAPTAAAAVLVAAALLGASVAWAAEERVFLAAALVAAWLVVERRALPALLLGAFTGILVYVKVSLAVASGVLLATALAAIRPRKALLLAASGAFAIALLALAPVLLGSFAHFGPFVQGYLETARGFSSAISLIGPARQVAFAAGCWAALAALAVWLFRAGETTALRILVAMAPATFLAFQHGFARQDGHVGAFFGVALFVPGIVALGAGSARTAVACAAALAACCALSVPALAPYDLWSPRTLFDLASLKPALESASHVRSPALRRELAAAGAEALRGHDLPQAWIDLIRANGGTADAIPAELGPFMTGAIRWAPPPVIQHHHAYTPWLDERTAAHFRGPKAPEFIVVRVESIDSRHPLLDLPLGFLAIRERYEVAARDPAGRRLLLRKRAAPARFEYAAQPRTFQPAGRAIAVPPDAHRALVALDLRPTPKGRLQRALWRTAPIFVRLQYADGGAGSVRLVPDLAGEGLPLGALPRDIAELERWMDGEPAAAVESFSLSGPGLGGYGEVIGVQWLSPK